ncbi:ATP-binding protein [Streptomyces sp. NPDC006514]|uniref:ATP-binding protein n=1 Tax=Streptomyces sp. NPDC006514 TaxID=3154308 RepID=UPI0033A3E276
MEAEPKKDPTLRLITINEVGYIPFDQDAANQFFQLVASRYERGSVMVTSDLPFEKPHTFPRTCIRRRRNHPGSVGLRFSPGDGSCARHL